MSVFTSHKRAWLTGALVLIAVFVGAFLSANRFLAPKIRANLVRIIESRFKGKVELGEVSIRIFPKLQISVEKFVLRREGQEELPPFIAVDQVSAEGTMFGLLAKPPHLRRVELVKLQVYIPPRGSRQIGPKNPKSASSPSFILDEVVADGAFLEILPKDPRKLPLDFELKQLALTEAGNHQEMSFRSTLTNPKPPGEIQTVGKFGPWKGDEPASTPVSGSYTFQNADLSVFQGLAGMLSSVGNYHGTLDNIEVDGTTDIPDFTVQVSHNPVHLKTQFHAIVDGTDGDTYLQPVNAQFGSSSLTAAGKVEGTPGVKGKSVLLDVTVKNGRLEDMLRLGVKGSPPMMGIISYKTQLVIPPGHVDISHKIQLQGQFDIDKARFKQLSVQQRVDALSRRGRGAPKDMETGDVASNFEGSFSMKHGVMSFTNLGFDVPGVDISLYGTYGLDDEQLDLHGTARLEAKLSHTVTGFKSFLLKAVDPFFAKQGAGAVLPIKIQGSRSDPKFGLELFRKQVKEQ